MARYILTGAPGTGKTSLLDALQSSVTTVPEPARRVLNEHNALTGGRLDAQPELFVQRLIDRSLEDFHNADSQDITLYDRGLPDVVAYATVSGVDPAEAVSVAQSHRYEPTVFIAPLWEEIYATDELRNATFDQVAVFDEHLRSAYETLRYQLVELPLAPLAERVEFLVEALIGPSPPAQRSSHE